MLGLDLKFTGHPLTKRAFNAMKNEVLADAGRRWHREMRPKHFTTAGAREYNYRPRKGERGNTDRKGFRRSYTGRKLRMMGHTRPLEFTGEGKRLSRIQDVRATSKRVRVILPRKFNFRNPHSQINMREELTTISKREEELLIESAGELLVRRMNEFRERRNVKA